MQTFLFDLCCAGMQKQFIFCGDYSWKPDVGDRFIAQSSIWCCRHTKIIKHSFRRSYLYEGVPVLPAGNMWFKRNHPVLRPPHQGLPQKAIITYGKAVARQGNPSIHVIFKWVSPKISFLLCSLYDCLFWLVVPCLSRVMLGKLEIWVKEWHRLEIWQSICSQSISWQWIFCASICRLNDKL